MNLKNKNHSRYYKTGILLCVIISIVACSRKNDTWTNRNFHKMGSYYNILYHGNEAIELGKKQVKENYNDNYWEILPIERIGNSDDSTVYGKMVDRNELRVLKRPPSVGPKAEKKPEKENKEGSKSTKSQDAITNAFSNFGNNNANNQQNGGSNNNQNNNVFGNNANNQNNNDFGNNRNGINNNNRGNSNNQFDNQNQSTQNYNNQTNNMNNNPNGQNNQMGNIGRNQNNSPMGSGSMGGGQQGVNYQNGGQQNNQGQFSGQTGNFGNMSPNSRNQQNGISSNMVAQGSSRNAPNMGFNPQNRGINDDPENQLSSEEAFDRAEEKAAKAIQKHNMLINGVEHNPKMKDAFLLLGQSRYYNERYFPALEAFNYILQKYEDEKYLTAARIWKEKVYMRLENYDHVIKNITSILNDGSELSEDDIIEASSTLAQAYIKDEQFEKAIAPLDIAINTTRNHEQKGRYLFIKGQLYENLNQIDSANANFDKVIALNRKSPRIYMIHSYMEKGKNGDLKTEKRIQPEILAKMLEDRENRPFLDIINYRMAEYYREKENMPKAITYYNKSLQTNLADHPLKYHIYKTLGDYYFDDAKYRTAGAYYDSTMVNLPEASREYRTYKRKRLNLNDVIFYEDIANKSDSILRLARMKPEEQKAYFQNYADSLKTIAIADAKKAKKDAKRSKMANMFGQQKSQAGGPSGAFYFYNASQVAAGRQSYRQIWGKRELQDNWRTKKGHVTKKEEKETEEKDFMAIIEANPAFKAETYLSRIPQDKQVIDSISDDRNFAYYQLGVIYNEKFKEYKLAASKLGGLLDNNPEERLILPSKYNLYKIYEKLGDKAKMEKWKQDILTNHPDSRYAQILKNPESLKHNADSPEQVYYRIYKEYAAGNYQKAIDDCEENITLFTGDEIVPKMELLKATAKGRLYGFDAYKKGLDYVALTYPQSEEGKKAEEIIKDKLPKLKSAKFVKNAEGNYNLLYPFEAGNRKEAEKLEKLINKGIKEFGYNKLATSIDTYSPDKIFVVVRGLRSKMGAEGFGKKLELEKKYKVKRPNIGISSVNYETILIHKNFERYVQKFGD